MKVFSRLYICIWEVIIIAWFTLMENPEYISGNLLKLPSV